MSETVVYDIETLPTADEEVIKFIKDGLKAPGNMSKPETIQKWMDDPDNLIEAINKTGLDGTFGTIFCIGYAIDDDPVVVLKGDEKDIVTEFRDLICNGSYQPQCKLVGQNILKFDNLFLSKRMMRHGLGPLWPYGTPPYKLDFYDTMTAWAGYGNYISLDALCLALGIESPKGDMTGADVYQYWLDGRHDEIYKYQKDDVTATRRVYHHLTGNPNYPH